MSDQLFLELPLPPAFHGELLGSPTADAEVRWLRWDPLAEEVREQGSLAAERLGDLGTRFPGASCYAVIPGEVVSWHQVVLPKGGRVGLDALPFQLEERLCSDLDSIHIAHAQIHANKPTNVLIVERGLMEFWHQLLVRSALRVKALLPDFGAIPENVLVFDERRTAAHLAGAAAAVKADNFPVWWQLATSAAEPEQSQVYAAASLENADILPGQPQAFFEHRLEALAASWQPWLPSLLCGKFSINDEQSALVKKLVLPVVLLVTLLLVHWLNLGLAIWDNQRQLALLDSKINEIYLNTFPGARVVNARSQMRSQLKALESGGSASPFLPWLEKLANATRGKGEITVQQLSYATSPLQIKLSVTAGSYDLVDQWIAALKAQGLDVERGAFGAAGQNDNRVTGQLTLRGAE